MFAKLLKYEFKYANNWYWGLYGIILSISVILGIWLSRQPVHFINYLMDDNVSSMAGTDNSSIIFIILSFILFGLFLALTISTFFLIIHRFKSNIYDRQGYLTLTLPVNQHQIILSKLIGALIWSFLSMLTLIVSVLIIAGMIILSKNISINLPSISFNPADLAYGTINVITNTSASILLFYFAISIGQLFQDYRTAIAIISFFAISLLVGLLSSTLLSITDNKLPYILFELAQLLFYYAGTYYILKNKVNLQ